MNRKSSSKLITENTLQLSSVKIGYQKAGAVGAQTILLLHGLGTRASFWQLVIPALVDEGFQVYALDLPGFGYSDLAADLYSPVTVGNLIGEFVQALDLTSVIVIGHSMGGTMAGSFAISDPANIKALILVDAFGFSKNLIPVSTTILVDLAIPSLYYRLLKQTERLISAIIESNFHDSERLSPEIVELAITENWIGRSSDRMKIVYGLVRSLGLRGQRSKYMEDLRNRYRAYRFPILVIWGQEDALIPVSGAYQIKSEIPETRLQIIPDCGHVPPLEKTAEFNQEIIQFLKVLK